MEAHVELCLRGIRESFDPVATLWNRQIRDGEWASTLGTEDITSTLICLIGIDRFDCTVWEDLELDPQAALGAAGKRLADHPYPGGIGLLVWANALHGDLDPHRLLRLFGEVDSPSAALTSMEASWLLSGLVHEYAIRPTVETRKVAERVVLDLHARLDGAGRGLMPHATRRASFAHMARRHTSNFADQIYTLQALSFAAITLGSEPSFERARQLATRLVELQGPLGQWWWHYDSRTGEVADRFPVYSVHQHAMAPMALMAFAAAASERGEPNDVSSAIERSHAWLHDNELGIDMVDPAGRTIWRDIEYDIGALQGKIRHARAALGYPAVDVGGQAPGLLLNRETRPYEWAWHLYSQALLAGTERKSHVV